jgi:hypothetical protein
MKLGKLKNAQLSKQSHEIGFVQRVQFKKLHLIVKYITFIFDVSKCKTTA